MYVTIFFPMFAFCLLDSSSSNVHVFLSLSHMYMDSISRLASSLLLVCLVLTSVLV